MSFSGEIKEELSKHWSPARHCQIAELAAIVSMCGNVLITSKGEYCIKVHTENLAVARKCFTLIKKTFNISTEISIRRNVIKKSVSYIIFVKKHEDAIRILQATKLLDEYGDINEELSIVRNIVVQQTCCKRAFIRGAFLAAGSISDPKKSYHFEIVCATMKKGKQLQDMINSFSMDAKVVPRKKSYVVYVKEGSQIVDLLNIMEAHVALMELENVRILKEMRNTVNRKVNCETANISKTVSAAFKQVEDITYIRDNLGFNKLSEGLEDIALTRLMYPDATLKELGDLLTPAVGKSGVNHRLRKLSDIAAKLRKNKEVHYD
ncbi:MAG: DNA-binding protein WhiA [Lachnospiraceae bacterium]|nr:DNA-binding protein WhiA [Lachnospiraceae bacterium]